MRSSRFGSGARILLVLAALSSAAVGAPPKGGDSSRGISPTAPVAIRFSAGEGPSLGSPDAPVTIVEFSDFHCPFCRVHFLETFPELRSRYIDTGKVRYLYRDFPLRPESKAPRRLSEAARCADEQGQFWALHREFFTSRKGSAPEEIRRLARALPLDFPEFEACLADGTYSQTIRDDEALGRKLGVTGTPTFFVGRSSGEGVVEAVRLTGARRAGDFRRVIDALLPGGR